MKWLGEFLFWWGNRRSAMATVKLLDDLCITPQTLVDMGANNSQWTKYLHQRWPEMEIHSFEPNPKCKPLGTHHKVALGNIPVTRNYNDCGKQGHISDAGSVMVHVVRFEQYWGMVGRAVMTRPAVLKVDCENFTEAALRGCGERLKDFALVHVEMMNTRHEPQFLNRQAAIFELMLDAGFKRCECVDAAVWPRSVHYYDLVFVR